MKHILFLVMLVTSSVCFAQVPKFDWIHQIGDANGNTTGSISVDENENVYITGTFLGPLTIGPSTINSYDIFTSSGFLAKYDAAGVPQFAIVLPVSQPVGIIDYKLTKMVVSPTGKIFLIGSLIYGGGPVAYIAVIRANGTVAYYTDQSIGLTPTDIAIDEDENFYISGNNDWSTTAYLSKADSIGNVKWAYNLATPSKSYNVLYTNGKVQWRGQFDTQVEIYDTVSAASTILNATSGLTDWDFFLANYTDEGALLTTGQYDGLFINAPAGPFNINGVFTASNKWKITWMNGTDARLKTFDTAFGTTLSGVVYVYSCPSTAESFLSANPYNDTVAIQVNGSFCASPEGALIDTIGYGYDVFPMVTGAANYALKRRLAMGKNNNVYILSGFIGNMQYQDGNGTQTIASNSGALDLYVAKYHKCPIPEASIGVYVDTIKCADVFPGYSYQWELDSIAIPGATNTWYVASASGYYSVSFTDGFCTFEFGYNYTHNPTGIVSMNTVGVSVYPNPVTDDLHIQGVDGEVTVLDIFGRPLLKKVVENNESFNLSSFASGTYFLKTPKGYVRFNKE
jgi:hypothetical protein